jgi:hypothetical protein
MFASHFVYRGHEAAHLGLRDAEVFEILRRVEFCYAVWVTPQEDAIEPGIAEVAQCCEVGEVANMPAVTCAYVSAVRLIVECPSAVETVLRSTPLSSIRLAYECRKS